MVDDADYEMCAAESWYADVYRSKNIVRRVYASRHIRKDDGRWTTQYLHRFILGISDPRVKVDHRQGIGLDNQRGNLRAATNMQNSHNQVVRSDNTSGFKGVTWDKAKRKWRALITVEGKKLHIGYFSDALQAALAYDAAAREHFGEFALCNFPPKKPCMGRALAYRIDAGEIPA
jgi:hypothetical protein